MIFLGKMLIARSILHRKRKTNFFRPYRWHSKALYPNPDLHQNLAEKKWRKNMTVEFGSIANFGSLNHHEAEKVVYDQLLNCCETKSVFLSEYGNNESPNAHPIFGGLSSKEEYYHKKEERSLFNIERIQRVYRALNECIQETSQYKSSGPLKHRITKHLDETVPEGEFIVAMMVKGYFARFGKRGDPLNVSCEFRAIPQQMPL